MTTTAPSDTPQTALDGHERAVDMLIGDRAMVSRMLREHQALRWAIEHNPGPCYVCDAEDRLIVWSDAFERIHAGVFAEHGLRIGNGDLRYPELIRHHVEATCAPKDVEARIEADLDAHSAADGEPVECDHGEHGIFQVSKYAIPGGTVVAMAAPIDGFKTRETELIHARGIAEAGERAKAEFLANMSHEIRTPMNGILGMIELLGNSTLDRKQQLYADVIARSGQAMMTIIDDIIDLSRIEAGDVTLQPASFDFTEAMEDTALLFSAAASDSGVDLIVRVDPTLPKRMIGDAGRLRQIVSNLLSNALKFTETGHVFLDIGGGLHRRADGREIASLSIAVQDTGCGIPDDVLAGTFVAGSRSKGLGLSIVNGLVDALGGTIDAQSVEGHGTTVTVTLDLPVDAGRIITRTKDGLAGKHVLLMDITAARCTILNEQLTAWGFQTAACADMREGMTMLDRLAELGTPADLVILGNAGRAWRDDDPLLDSLRADSGQCPPIVILDGIDGIVAAAEAADTGVFASLPCPGRSSQLLDTIERALMTERPASSERQGDAVPSDVAAPPLSAMDDPLEPEAGDVLMLDDGDDGHVEPFEPGCSDTIAAAPADDAERIDILIAEDNEINQFLLEQILCKTGHSYRVVSDGRQALDAWRTTSPRLILMDLAMPNMSGDEAAVAIRKAEAGTGQRVPIVAVTAHALRGDRERCTEAGMDDYLSKPVKSADVIAVIHRWIGEDAMRQAG